MVKTAIEERKEAIAFYKTIQEYEHHFNNIEFEVRKIASTWMLASFGTIAFLIRGDLVEPKSLIGTIPLIVIVCLLAQIGLFVLWILDQVVYHGLLDAAFTAALHIEHRIEELPPLRSLMMRISAGDRSGVGGVGMARYLKYFYLIPMLLFTAAAWIAAHLAIIRGAEGQPLWIGLAALTTALPVWALIKTRQIEAGKLRNRPTELGTYANHPYDVAVERWFRAMKAPQDRPEVLPCE